MAGMADRSKLKTGLIVGAGVVLVAVTVFKVPLASFLLLGVVLLCPLMMLGMHGAGHRHGGTEHGHGTSHEDPPADRFGEGG